MQNWKRLAIIGGAVLLLGALWWGKLQQPQYQTYTVKKEKITYRLKEQGQVVYQPMQQVYAEIGGKVLTVRKKAGDQVKAGEVLAELDTSDLKAQLQQLEGELTALAGSRQALTAAAGAEQARLAYELAEISYQQAHFEWQRAQELAAAGAISAAAAENYQRSWQQAEKELARARALWQNASRQLAGQQQAYAGQKQSLLARWQALKQQIDRGQIRSPFSGWVLADRLQEGEFVQPGQSLFTVGEPRNWQVEIRVAADQATLLSPGQEVEISWQRVGEQLQLKGRVVEVGWLAEKAVTALGVEEPRVLVKVAPRLATVPAVPRAGTAMEVKFLLREVEALAVPRELLLQGEDGVYLQVLRQGKVEKVKVATGLEGNELVEIKAGLKAGEQVVINQQ